MLVLWILSGWRLQEAFDSLSAFSERPLRCSVFFELFGAGWHTFSSLMKSHPASRLQKCHRNISADTAASFKPSSSSSSEDDESIFESLPSFSLFRFFLAFLCASCGGDVFNAVVGIYESVSNLATSNFLATFFGRVVRGSWG